jgi:hypothetical protein
VANTQLNFRHYSGGIEVQNLGQAGTDNMSLEGHGQLVLNANCAGGTIAIRGNFTITDNVAGGFVVAGGVLSDDARFTRSEMADATWDEDVTTHVTANSAGAALDALGTAIDARSNNANLNALLGVPDAASVALAAIPLAGIAQAGSSATLIVDAVNLTQADADYWKDGVVHMLSGAAVGQSRPVSAFDQATDTITVSPAFTSAVANTDVYIITRQTAATGSATAAGVAAIADGVWDEDIVAAHGTASTAGLLLRALGANITTRANNATLEDLLGVADTAATDTVAGQVWEETNAGHATAGSMGEVMSLIAAAGYPSDTSIADAVWDEDIVSAHGTADTGGLLLRALGALISQRSNNPTLHGILGCPDVVNTTLSPYALVGTATAVTGNNIIEDTANLTATDDDFWNNAWCVMLSGNAAGQVRRVLDFIAADDTITVTPSFTTAGGLAIGDEFAIIRHSHGASSLDALASAALTDEIWDELTAGHAIANSAGQRLQALDVLLEAGGAGDAAEMYLQLQKVDKAALLAVGDPGYDADSIAGDLNSLITTVATIDRDILCSVNLEGSDLRIEVAAEQYGLIVTGTYTQASCQIFDEGNSIVATIGVGDFGAVTARGFWQYDLNPHPLIAGHTYQIQILLDDGVGGTYQNTKLFKVVNV